MFRGDPPSTRLNVVISSFLHPKSNHEKFIKGHQLNSQVEIIIPGIPQRVYGPITTFLDPIMLSLIRKGDFVAMSDYGIHSSNNFCISGGKLFMSLEKDTFQQLGLEGKPSKFHEPRGSHFDLTIDLNKMNVGSKIYERTKWCLSRLSPARFLCTNGQEISFPNEYDSKKKEIVVEGTEEKMFDIDIPNIDIQRCAAPPKGQKREEKKREEKKREEKKREEESDMNESEESESEEEEEEGEEDEEYLMSLYDWIGAITTRMTSLITVSGYVGLDERHDEYTPQLPYQGMGECYTYRSRGMISSRYISDAVSELRDLIDRGAAPFAVISVWGFLKSPISWNECRHSDVFCGENDYAIILLPNGKYVIFTALGDRDVYS
ncbi:RNase P protein subunit [Planoprotostelium fungivorum]|uniref:RNase P protein subunit n=1 Tax=Planoprotostelium fungivorum TaxID=1890364 RepID=A0A2P6NSI2_9EUKA|nr:RNase P protein subunit [Planoprotostelium fungivorum]